MNVSDSAPQSVQVSIPFSDHWTVGISKSAFIFRGIIALLLGIMLLAEPLTTLTVITVSIGILMIFASGAVFSGAVKIKSSYRWMVFVYAVSLLVLGGLAVFRPMMVEWLWILMLAGWQLMAGINALILMFDKKVVSRSAALFSGVTSILLGVLLAAWPFTGLAMMMWLFGVIMILFSFLMFALAFKGLPKTAA